MIEFDSREIEHWADMPDAPSQFPHLISKLILATTTVTSLIDIPSGSSVWKPGWDGLLEVETGNAWVPSGASAWEFGVGNNPQSKASEDYRKRTKNPLGVDRQYSSFVFVTPRVWSGKRDWIEKRQEENEWADVRAYDADDLTTWLGQMPSVADWFARLIGKLPDEGVACLDDWWEHWTSGTHPEISPELVLAGRAEQSEAIRNWLAEPASSFYVQGDTRDEAIAYLAASALAKPDSVSAALLAKSIVVESIDAWRILERSNNPMVLIRNFVGDVSSQVAVSKGHHVVVPLDSVQEPRGNGLTLPILGRDETVEALKSMGLTEARARALSRKAARRLRVMRRFLLEEAGTPLPEWTSPTLSRSLIALVQIGQWSDDKEGDREAVGRLAGKPYEEVELDLIPLLNIADSPLTKIGTRWRYVSHEEAWHILAPYLTSADATRFEKLAVEILSRKSPAFDLPVKERWLANVKGKVLPHSGTLVEGITRGLALMGTQPDRMKNIHDAPYIPGRVVFRVLDDSSDWRTWATLDRHLATLAEAAPDAFLDAIERALNSSPSPFETLFAQEGDPMFSGTPHAGLLWGLERLAWSKDHFSRVAILLARLAELDPGGGQVANGPSRSLAKLFCAWISFTEATDKHRLETLSMLAGKHPAVGWSVLVNAYPSAVHNSIVLRNPPLWQPWAQDGVSPATNNQLWIFVEEMLRLLLENVGTDAARWKDLVKILTEMPQEAREDALTLLTQQADSLKQDAEAEPLRAAIRVELYRHRSYPDAKWAMPPEDVEALDSAYRKLEPSDPVLVYTWLFDSEWIDMPDGERGDYAENRERAAVAQQDAVRKIFDCVGIDAILNLIDEANAPYTIGVAVAGAIDADEAFLMALDCIKSESQKRKDFAMQFFNARCRQSDWEVLDKTLASIKSEEDFNPEVVATMYISASQVDLKACLQRLGDEPQAVQDAYWSNVNWFNFAGAKVEKQEFIVTVQHLLDAGRSLSVAQLIWSREVSDELLIRTLGRIPTDWANGTDTLDPDLSYICTELFERLDKSENVTNEVITKLEIPLIGMISQRRPNLALHGEALRDPSLFADLIALMFNRADGKDEYAVDDQTREAQVSLSFQVLSSLRGLPGQSEDGTIDLETLTAWVSEARRLCEERDRKDIGDQKIGEVLANATVGADGAWPCEPVRDLLDILPSPEHIGIGFQTGLYNQRGVTSRGIYDGGAQERSLAERYRKDAAEIAAQWPFTAKLLRGIAVRYEADARREDTRAAWTDESGL